MLGPIAASGSAGGAPRCSGTSLTSSARLSGIHCSSLSSIGLRRTPGTLRSAPVAASPIHSSTASLAVLANAKRLPSADQYGRAGQAPAGSVTLVDAPPGTATSSNVLAHGVTP